MTAHVFIVDHTTLKVHLEYLFAGTGSGERSVDFNNKAETKMHHTTEKILVSMIADAGRIRQGDKIIFYLQTIGFYGIFQATENFSFLDKNDKQQYLRAELRKSLTFRTLIEPYEVYAESVSEWEALDQIKDIKAAYEMQWSLIYRKLRGKRGNTMITMSEEDRLLNLIKNKNNNKTINSDTQKLSFDEHSNKIVTLPAEQNEYSGRKEKINILPRLIYKMSRNQAFEIHLQAYIMNSIGQGINKSLDSCILGDDKLEWLGNEVSCGVGMQKIDIMLSSIGLDHKRSTKVIELKRGSAIPENVEQIRRYLHWAEQYYMPNNKSKMQAMLITRKKSNQQKELIEAIKSFNNEFSAYEPLKYIQFDLVNDDVHFELTDYQ